MSLKLGLKKSVCFSFDNNTLYKALHRRPMLPSFNIKIVMFYKDKLTVHFLEAGTEIGQMPA